MHGPVGRSVGSWAAGMMVIAALVAGPGARGAGDPPGPDSAAGTDTRQMPAGAAADDRVKKWRADLGFLATEFAARHKNAFFECPRERWDGRVEEIRGRLGEMSDAEVLAALRQLVAMIGDAHSTVWADKESSVSASRMYPVACAWLSDGVYPAVLPREHEGLIGRRLVRVGSQSINDVIARLSLVQATDNESGRKNQTMATLREADTLAALGIVKDIEHAEWVLADGDGNETTIVTAPIPPDAAPAQVMVQRPDPGKLCFSRQFRRAAYGEKLLEDARTLYVWYDTCADRGPKSVQEWCAGVLATIDEGVATSPARIERVVIDLRRNGGGNSVLLAPLIDGLARRESINRKGKLFALIGRRTFSSAMMNAYQLRNATKCQLVGEPTGGSPNGYGEVKQFRLPNSKLVVQYSTKHFKGPTPGDSVLPDIAVEEDAKAYFDPGRDAVLEAAIKHREQGGEAEK